MVSKKAIQRIVANSVKMINVFDNFMVFLFYYFIFSVVSPAGAGMIEKNSPTRLVAGLFMINGVYTTIVDIIVKILFSVNYLC